MSDGGKERLLGEEQSVDETYSEDPLVERRRIGRPKWRSYLQPLKLAFVLSAVLNICLLSIQLWPERASKYKPDRSLFAGLTHDSSMTFEPYSKYGVGNSNETDRTLMWEGMRVSIGEVALDKQWAREKGLPESQPFPWDHSKGIYLLNGHHSLHCLRKIRRWVTIAYHNGTQLDAYSHVVHCMSALLQNILCEADDTPIYTTTGLKKDAGYAQTRQCRSWDQLNEWAESHTACYGFINETQGVNTTFERYKWCPTGSVYAERMRERLGLPSDWNEERPSEMDSMPPYWQDFKHNEFVFHELTDE